MEEKKILNNKRLTDKNEFIFSKNMPIEVMDIITEIINHIKENEKLNELGKVND